MKGSSSKRTALKGDVIGPENILFAGNPCIFSPEILQAGAVKGLNQLGRDESRDREPPRLDDSCASKSVTWGLNYESGLR